MIERVFRERTVTVDLADVIRAQGLDPEATRVWANVKDRQTTVWAELVVGEVSLLEQEALPQGPSAVVASRPAVVTPPAEVIAGDDEPDDDGQQSDEESP